MSKKLSQHKCYQWKIPSDFIQINFVIDTNTHPHKKKPSGFAYYLLTSVRNVISAEVCSKDSLFGWAVIFGTLSFLCIRYPSIPSLKRSLRRI